MGRSILADERVEAHLTSLFGKEKCHIGLLIGQIGQQKDYVVHAARTPKDDGKDHNLEKLDEKWIAHHATQVLRMLPGGLSIVGIFVIASPDQVKAAQGQLRQCLFAIKKRLDKIYPLSQEDVADRILLQVCSVSKKITCRTFDVADPKSAARPADWKYQNILDRWLSLRSRLVVNVTIPVPTEATSLSLEKQMQNGVLPTCNNILNSLCLLNGEMCDAETSIDTGTTSQSKKGGKKQQTTTANSMDVKLLLAHSSQVDVRTPSTVECSASLVMRGAICGRAFVTNKSTSKDAENVMKSDFCRSLLFRNQLLCEDLLQSEEEQDPSIVYESPVRVFAPLPGSPLYFCDYMFQDEGVTESAERFREILDFDVKESSIDVACERVPDDNDLAVPMKVLPMKQRAQQSVMPSAGSAVNMMGATMAGMVAFLAAGLSYMYLGQEG